MEAEAEFLVEDCIFAGSSRGKTFVSWLRLQSVHGDISQYWFTKLHRSLLDDLYALTVMDNGFIF